MTHYVVSMIWPDVPEAQRQRLIALLGQMATRHLATALSRKGKAYDRADIDQLRGLYQNAGAAPRSLGRGVCPPIDAPAMAAPSGVDPAPIRPR
jgi:hypothetical protein